MIFWNITISLFAELDERFRGHPYVLLRAELFNFQLGSAFFGRIYCGNYSANR